MSMKASVTSSVIVKTEGSTLTYIPGDLQFDEIFATRAIGQIAEPPSRLIFKIGSMTLRASRESDFERDNQ